jgi:predicted alpha/beta superfamily hydrolase
MKLQFAFLALVCSVCCRGQERTQTVYLYSAQVKDSFELKISLVGPVDSSVPLSTVYYLDANLRSGRKLRQLLSDSVYSSHLRNTLFIGIGYKGENYFIRSRDFIPPLYKTIEKAGKQKATYGHADQYYAFLTKELIPTIEKRYVTNGRRTLIGHSYGGLFVFYTLFQQPQLFQNYIALSPSLWVNRGDIFHYEKAYYSQSKELEAYLYLSAGTKEGMNHVLRTTRKMERLLAKRAYAGLQLDYFEHKGKAHHTQVPVSLDYVLKHVAF